MMTVEGGYGYVPYGHAEFGHAKSKIEPRFSASVPEDGVSGVSVYQTVINCRVYGFSSRSQLDGLYVEISEDGGGSYSDAYSDGFFVSPYNGAGSRVDAHRAEPHVLLLVVEKISFWTDNQQIKVRVTVFDEYDQGVSKEIPIVWGA